MTQVHPKVTAAATGSGTGGALAIILVWVFSLCGVTVPANVEEAFTVVLGVGVALVAGYFTPSPKGSL